MFLRGVGLISRRGVTSDYAAIKTDFTYMKIMRMR